MSLVKVHDVYTVHKVCVVSNTNKLLWSTVQAVAQRSNA